jgi:hypothetical protein
MGKVSNGGVVRSGDYKGVKWTVSHSDKSDAFIAESNLDDETFEGMNENRVIDDLKSWIDGHVGGSFANGRRKATAVVNGKLAGRFAVMNDGGWHGDEMDVDKVSELEEELRDAISRGYTGRANKIREQLEKLGIKEHL